MNELFEHIERVAKETGKDVREIIDHAILFLEGKKLENTGEAGLSSHSVEDPGHTHTVGEPVAPVPVEPVTPVVPVEPVGESATGAVGESVSGSPAGAVAPTTETPAA